MSLKIALVGKGGSGKTTLTALLVRHLVATGRPVLACDLADQVDPEFVHGPDALARSGQLTATGPRAEAGGGRR